MWLPNAGHTELDNESLWCLSWKVTTHCWYVMFTEWIIDCWAWVLSPWLGLSIHAQPCVTRPLVKSGAIDCDCVTGLYVERDPVTFTIISNPHRVNQLSYEWNGFVPKYAWPTLQLKGKQQLQLPTKAPVDKTCAAPKSPWFFRRFGELQCVHPTLGHHGRLKKE